MEERQRALEEAIASLGHAFGIVSETLAVYGQRISKLESDEVAEDAKDQELLSQLQSVTQNFMNLANQLPQPAPVEPQPEPIPPSEEPTL